MLGKSISLNLFISLVGAVIVDILFAILIVVLLLYIRKISIEKEKYDLIARQQQDIWLDYQFSPQNLKVTGNISNLTEEESLNLMGVEVFEIYDWVHKEDTSIRSIIRQFFDSGDHHFKTELRIKQLDSSYGWYTLTGALLKKKNGKNKRFVARMQNIDSRMKEEKKLMQKAENDLLTGIFNKKTMEEKIEEAIENRQNNEHYIFFMIDLDNFKTVNDTLGHIYGDKVLTDTSDKLKEVFPVNAIIGRLGGDEFAVCASFDAFDASNLLKYMEKKAGQLCETLREHYCCDGLGVDVSASIGIAVAPEDGMDFESIYRKADKALYLSKRSGKDRFNIFQSSDANE